MSKVAPCVYFSRGGYPQFFVVAADVSCAVNIAHGLRHFFRVPAWVAGWSEIAHRPTTSDRYLQQARAAAHRSRPEGV